MKTSSLRVALFVAALAAFAPMLARAAAIEPPSEFLFKFQHAIVAGDVIRASADGTLEIRVRDTLHGAEPPSELRVRVSPQWLAGFESGQRVLVAYTLYRRSSSKPKALEVRRDGPVILVSAGLEPALFHDTANARALLAGNQRDGRVPGRAWLDEVLEGLGTEDLQVQNFHAAELVLREPLHALLDGRDHVALARVVNDRAAHPSARASLLVAAAAHPDHFGAQWAAESALAIIDDTSITEADAELSLLPNLVRIAFDVVERSDRRIPVASAERWLGSAQVGLAEAALLAIRRTAPERERAVAEKALAQADLAPASREFLRDHLRRLAIMQNALEAARAAAKGQG